jgi:hypothetical protein
MINELLFEKKLLITSLSMMEDEMYSPRLPEIFNQHGNDSHIKIMMRMGTK